MPIIIDDIIHLFLFDTVNGRLFWKNPPKEHRNLLGKEAGGARLTYNGKEYWVIKINGKAYKRGHLMFLFVHGYLPAPCLDHINGNSLDDRPINIRQATVTQNAWNHKKRKRKINLPMGVRSMKSGNYEARISYHKKQIHLGGFKTPSEAHSVYLEKRKELYADFA